MYRKENEALFFAGHNAEDIKSILEQKHGAKSPSFKTVFWRVHEVKWGNGDLKDSVKSFPAAKVLSSIENPSKNLRSTDSMSGPERSLSLREHIFSQKYSLLHTKSRNFFDNLI